MPTANMGLTLPTDHGSNDVWDTILDDVFGLLDAHDHSSGKGVKVPSSGLNINADVAWNSGGTYYAITGAKALDFQPSPSAGMTSYACALFVNSSDNELYWRTSGGTNVKLTDASSLNVTAFTGGIGGDYSSISALLDYDDATDTYRMRQESSGGVRQYAKLGVADIILREYDPSGDVTVPTNAVTIKSPDALAASYSVTFPATVAASNGLFLQGTTAGVLSFSNTTTQNITAPDYKFSNNIELSVPTLPGKEIGGTTHAQIADRFTTGASTNPIYIPISGLRVGDRIKAWNVAIKKNTSSATTLTARLYKTSSGGTATQIGTDQTNSGNATGNGFLGELLGSPETVAAYCQYYLYIAPSTSTGGDLVLGGDIEVDRP